MSVVEVAESATKARVNQVPALAVDLRRKNQKERENVAIVESAVCERDQFDVKAR